MTAEDHVSRPFWLTALLLAVSAALVVVFVLLGNWQMQRLAWKLDLIQAVDSRAFGAAVQLPEEFSQETHEYLRVTTQAEWRDAEPILVKAVTELGPGYWVMEALDVERHVLWVNRGFVPVDQKDPSEWQDRPKSVTGLLRATQPDGTMLEKNQPERWVSRDTVAMSKHRRLGDTLLYFMDAEHHGAPDAWPRGGLTHIEFRNSHLSYALTWYAMAVLFAAALIMIVWAHRRGKI